MASTNWIGGRDPELYGNPYTSSIRSGIGALQGSHLGVDAAGLAERAIGKRYQDRLDEIESDPNYGRNAAVNARLHDRALAEVGSETSDAYVKGAREDLAAKAQGASLGLSAASQDFEINKENYQREQSQTFGNSFVGGLLKDAIGYGTGALVGGGVSSLIGGAAGNVVKQAGGQSGLSLGNGGNAVPALPSAGDAFQKYLSMGGRGPMPEGEEDMPPWLDPRYGRRLQLGP